MDGGEVGMGLESRYPELSFITSVLDYEKRDVEWSRTEELSLNLPQAAQVLYVYGFSPHISPLLQWLNEDTLRDIVFIEEDLSVVARISEEGHGHLFSHERIHLRLRLDAESLDQFSETLVRDFPFENIGFVNLKMDQEAYEKLKMVLLRKSVVESAVSLELLHYQKLFGNLKANFPLFAQACDVGRWKGAFSGIPAVICGAGPSLRGAKEQIEKMQNRGIIMAGGSAITALSSYHIVPDLLFAIDPNHEEFIRLGLHTAFDSPLIYGCRLQPDVVQAHIGALAYAVTGTGGAIETWMEEQLGIQDPRILEGLSGEALSVTAVALKCAIYFGCNPITFAGIDLSYSGGSRYTEGVVSDMQCALEENFEKASDTRFRVEGKVTMAKWLMERDVIQDTIKKNPQVTFIDGTGKGLMFDGASVKQDWEAHQYELRDIKGLIHEWTESSKFSIAAETIEEKLNLLKQSFKKCHEIISEILEELEALNVEGETREETPREAVLEMDLEEEIAYQLALKGAAYAWTFHIKKALQKESSKRPLFFIKSRLYRKLQLFIEEYVRSI